MSEVKRKKSSVFSKETADKADGGWKSLLGTVSKRSFTKFVGSRTVSSSSTLTEDSSWIPDLELGEEFSLTSVQSSLSVPVRSALWKSA